MKTSSGLTDKQARFVKEYLIDSNATQAAIRAGYSEQTANEQGSRLLANVSVRQAVEAGQEKKAAKLEITALDLVREYEEVRMLAMTEKQLSAANGSIAGKAKLLGLEVEKIDMTSTVTLIERRIVRPANRHG